MCLMKSMKINYAELGKRIRQVRGEKKISQEKLAEMIGMSTQKVSEIEEGKTKMSLQVFLNLVNVLDTKIEVLLFN